MTIGMAVWLMQRHAYFGRAPGDAPCFSAYLANSIIAAMAAAGISLVFHSGDADPLAGTGYDLRGILLSFPLCAAAVFFRDHWAGDTTRPVGLCRTETAGCVSVIVLGIALLFFAELFPLANVLQDWRFGITVALSSALALMIGSCVPVIHHSVPQPATALRKTSQLLVPTAWGRP